MVGTELADTVIRVRHEVNEPLERRKGQYEEATLSAGPYRHADADGLPEKADEVLAMRRDVSW